MDSLQKYAPVVSRALIAALFLYAGFGKMTGFAMTSKYMESAGLPSFPSFVALVILVEFGGAVLLLLGYRTRFACAMLILFTLAATFVFHADFTAPNQLVMFLKDVAIIGGLVSVMASGAGAWSFDETLRGSGRG